MCPRFGSTRVTKVFWTVTTRLAYGLASSYTHWVVAYTSYPQCRLEKDDCTLGGNVSGMLDLVTHHLEC